MILLRNRTEKTVMHAKKNTSQLWSSKCVCMVCVCLKSLVTSLLRCSRMWSQVMYLPLSPVCPAWPSHDFFSHPNKIILKSLFPALINFVWGTLHLRLPQRCVVWFYVTHNQVYITFTATLHRSTCECTNFHVTRQAKESFLKKLAVGTHFILFPQPFSATFWVRKEIKFGYSCSRYRDTDSHHSEWPACITGARFGRESTPTQTWFL